jgi:hypothetical protein
LISDKSDKNGTNHAVFRQADTWRLTNQHKIRQDRHPTFEYPPVRFAPFSGLRLLHGVESRVIDGVSVPILGVAKNIADLFRYRQTVGVNVALEGLREALRQKTASPADIAREAVDAKVWKIMEPYMRVRTSHG